MKRVSLCLLSFAALLAATARVKAAETVQLSSSRAQDTAIAQVAVAASPFSEPVVLRGTLGDHQVLARLHAKHDEDGFEGEYSLLGDARTVLLAGELAGSNDVFMEESANGKDVSGQWSGKLKGDDFSGTWQSADGMVTKPFSMKIMRGVRDSDATPARPPEQASVAGISR